MCICEYINIVNAQLLYVCIGRMEHHSRVISSINKQNFEPDLASANRIHGIAAYLPEVSYIYIYFSFLSIRKIIHVT